MVVRRQEIKLTFGTFMLNRHNFVQWAENVWDSGSKSYSKQKQTSKIELFTDIVNGLLHKTPC